MATLRNIFRRRRSVITFVADDAEQTTQFFDPRRMEPCDPWENTADTVIVPFQFFMEEVNTYKERHARS